jgi:hypothetical protein
MKTRPLSLKPRSDQGRKLEQIHRAALRESITREQANQEGARGVLQVMPLATLCLVARGHLSLDMLAIDELANRGMDAAGEWVGFEKARELAAEYKSHLGG